MITKRKVNFLLYLFYYVYWRVLELQSSQSVFQAVGIPLDDTFSLHSHYGAENFYLYIGILSIARMMI